MRFKRCRKNTRQNTRAVPCDTLLRFEPLEDRRMLAGELDAAFGNSGLVTTDITGRDQGNAVAIQADGKIVVAGTADQAFLVTRYLPDGSLDDSFGQNGIVRTVDFDGFMCNSTPPILAWTFAEDLIIQPDGKIVVAGWLKLTCRHFDNSTLFALARYNIDGSLDTSFDDNGVLYDSLGSPGESAQKALSLAQQPDGKLIVAGLLKSPSTNSDDFAVASFNSDGSRDSSFIASFVDFSGGPDVANDIALQPDGRIVVAGYRTSSNRDLDFAVGRYLPGGNLDTSLDANGLLATDFSGGDDIGRAVALQSDGKIIVAGSSKTGTDVDFALTRYLVNGTLDSSFGVGGRVTTDFASSFDEGYGITIQADEKIIVAGESNGDFAVARYHADGSLDGTFGSEGKSTASFGPDLAIGRDVALQSDGRIVVVGHVSDPGSLNPFNFRYDDGILAVARFLGTPNLAPTAISTVPVVTSLADDTLPFDTIKLADIVVADDGLQGGAGNVLLLTGPDAGVFTLVGNELHLSRGVELDASRQSAYQVNIEVDDATVGDSPDASMTFTLDVTNAPPAAPTLVVDSLSPINNGDFSPGDFSLPEAVARANVNPGLDVIHFDAALSGQTIPLGGGEILISDDLTIDSSLLAAPVTIDGEQDSRIFLIDDGLANFVDVQLVGVTISGGQPVAGAHGGGILSHENLWLKKVRVTNSQTANDGASGQNTGDGGGVYSTGNLVVLDSTIAGNSTGARTTLGGSGGSGGGIFSSGTLVMRRSNVADNETGAGGDSHPFFAPGNGGDGGGIFTTGFAEIQSSTISGNTTGPGGANIGFDPEVEHGDDGWGGGIYLDAGVLTLSSSTLAQNISNYVGGLRVAGGKAVITHSTIGHHFTKGVGLGSGATLETTHSIIAGNFGTDVSASGAATVLSGGFNLIGKSNRTAAFDAAGDQVIGIADPLLGQLADNGGPTRTQRLLPGSPAVGAGDPNFDGPTQFDQRGAPFRRVAGAQMDIGAFEAQPTPVSADFDQDGLVDGSDFLRWQRGYGTTTSANFVDGDATLDGAVDANDLSVWQTTYGRDPSVPVAAPSADFIDDNVVTGADFLAWQRGEGDANGDGLVNGDDLAVWEQQYGQTQVSIQLIEFAGGSGPQLLLEVVGAGVDDTITVAEGASAGDLVVMYQNALGASFEKTVTAAEIDAESAARGLLLRGVLIRGLAGDDVIDLSGLSILTPAIVDAGYGDDDVTGTPAADILLGRRGADTLVGGGGMDIVIGGAGADVVAGDSLTGDSDEDVLIAGAVTNAIDLTALDAALTTWTGPGNYNERIEAIRDQGFIRNETVLDDQAIDQLLSPFDGTQSAFDWYFTTVDAPSGNDVIDLFEEGFEEIDVTHPPIPASELESVPFEAGLDGDGAIISLRLGVRPFLLDGSTPGAVTVRLLIQESRVNGEVILRLDQQIHLSELTLVGLGGPNGFAVLELAVDTLQLEIGSTVEVCTQLISPMGLDGGLNSGILTCQVVDLVSPL